MSWASNCAILLFHRVVKATGTTFPDFIAKIAELLNDEVHMRVESTGYLTFIDKTKASKDKLQTYSKETAKKNLPEKKTTILAA